jgi:hypothetical protein
MHFNSQLKRGLDYCSVRQVGKLTASVLAGMLPYGIIAWRSSARLPGSWGDLTNLSGFLTHLLRRSTPPFMLIISTVERAETCRWTH